ncbi:MAG: PilZ domain-containing protein [Lachnospiraceae bacterium]|nr:PilZ domain-containing protein [Lachnospiraceae bacterium]
MTINQSTEGSSVTLTVTIKGETLTFETRVTQPFQEPYKGSFCIGVEPILQEGKPVSLGQHKITASVKNDEDKREYLYTINFYGFNKDRTMLLLFSPDDVAATNHRLSYRVACSYDVVAQIGNNKKTVEGLLHDISITGLGMTFVSEEVKNVQNGDPVSISIFDQYDHLYKVFGQVVRYIEGFRENRILIGVQFDETPPAIAGLVASLQRKELRLRKKVEEKKQIGKK